MTVIAAGLEDLYIASTEGTRIFSDTKYTPISAAIKQLRKTPKKEELRELNRSFKVWVSQRQNKPNLRELATKKGVEPWKCSGYAEKAMHVKSYLDSQTGNLPKDEVDPDFWTMTAMAQHDPALILMGAKATIKDKGGAAYRTPLSLTSPDFITKVCKSNRSGRWEAAIKNAGDERANHKNTYQLYMLAMIFGSTEAKMEKKWLEADEYKQIITDTWNALGEVFDGLPPEVSGIIRQPVNLVKEAVGKLTKMLVADLNKVKQLFQDLWKVVKKVVQIISTQADFVKIKAVSTSDDVLKRCINTVHLKATFNDLKNFAKSFGKALMSVLSVALAGLKDYLAVQSGGLAAALPAIPAALSVGLAEVVKKLASRMKEFVWGKIAELKNRLITKVNKKYCEKVNEQLDMIERTTGLSDTVTAFPEVAALVIQSSSSSSLLWAATDGLAPKAYLQWVEQNHMKIGQLKEYAFNILSASPIKMNKASTILVKDPKPKEPLPIPKISFNLPEPLPAPIFMFTRNHMTDPPAFSPEKIISPIVTSPAAVDANGLAIPRLATFLHKGSLAMDRADNSKFQNFLLGPQLGASKTPRPLSPIDVLSYKEYIEETTVYVSRSQGTANRKAATQNVDKAFKAYVESLSLLAKRPFHQGSDLIKINPKAIAVQQAVIEWKESHKGLFTYSGRRTAFSSLLKLICRDVSQFSQRLRQLQEDKEQKEEANRHASAAGNKSRGVEHQQALIAEQMRQSSHYAEVTRLEDRFKDGENRREKDALAVYSAEMKKHLKEVDIWERAKAENASRNVHISQTNRALALDHEHKEEVWRNNLHQVTADPNNAD